MTILFALALAAAPAGQPMSAAPNHSLHVQHAQHQQHSQQMHEQHCKEMMKMHEAMMKHHGSGKAGDAKDGADHKDNPGQ